jgi:hypothetical protein
VKKSANWSSEGTYCRVMTPMFLRRRLGDALASRRGLSLGVLTATTEWNMASPRPALALPWRERRGRRRLEAPARRGRRARREEVAHGEKKSPRRSPMCCLPPHAARHCTSSPARPRLSLRDLPCACCCNCEALSHGDRSSLACG